MSGFETAKPVFDILPSRQSGRPNENAGDNPKNYSEILDLRKEKKSTDKRRCFSIYGDHERPIGYYPIWKTRLPVCFPPGAEMGGMSVRFAPGIVAEYHHSCGAGGGIIHCFAGGTSIVLYVCTARMVVFRLS